MRDEWVRYLQSIGFKEPLMDRAEEVVRFWTEIVEIKPSFLFVSEYKSGGNRVYESICLFDEDSVYEAIEFSREDNFDCVPLRNRIIRWNVQAKNFNWVSPNAGSRLKLDIWFGPNSLWSLKASGNNCSSLAELLTTYIVPHAVSHPTGGSS